MKSNQYIMESDDETLRLEMKTNIKVVENQALWAGLKPGMKVADIGCGTGKTTSVLHKMVLPDGKAVGVDGSKTRLKYAETNYKKKGVQFTHCNILQLDDSLGKYDFIWVRFILEYFLKESSQIVKRLSEILNPGGILCLIDLDHNSLNHFGIPTRLEKTITRVMHILQVEENFDPFMGRKLYSYMYDLGLEDIQVDVSAHHLIYGDLKNTDSYNWLKKIEVVSNKINYQFEDYKGGFDEFLEEFIRYFSHPRRFTYTPVIACRGVKPQ